MEEQILTEAQEHGLEEAIRYLEYGPADLWEGDFHAGIRRMARLLAEPTALFLATFAIPLLSLVYLAFRFSLSASFSLGLLTYLVPLLTYFFLTRRAGERALFFADVDRSDEIMMDVGIAHLLEWPEGHPQQSKEEEISKELLQQWLDARVTQLKEHLETHRPPVVEAQAGPSEDEEDEEEDAIESYTHKSAQALWVEARSRVALVPVEEGQEVTREPGYERDRFEPYQAKEKSEKD